MPDPQSTAMITEPPDATPDDGFDIGEIEKRMNPEAADPGQEPVGAEPEPEVTPEDPGAEPEPVAEPDAAPKKNVLDMAAEFPEPVGGKYKTLGDLVKAFEAQSTMVGEQGRKLGEAKEAMAFYELVKTDPAKAKAELEKLTVPDEELTLQEAIELNANPSAFIAKKMAEINATEARSKAEMERYEGALSKVYSASVPWEQSAEGRKAIQQAHESGQLGDPELYHLAHIGRLVRDSKLTVDGTKVETTPAIDPAAGGAGKVPKAPVKTKAEVDPRDALIDELDHSGAMV